MAFIPPQLGRENPRPGKQNPRPGHKIHAPEDFGAASPPWRDKCGGPGETETSNKTPWVRWSPLVSLLHSREAPGEVPIENNTALYFKFAATCCRFAQLGVNVAPTWHQLDPNLNPT